MRSSSRSQSPFLKSLLEKPKPMFTQTLHLRDLKIETENQIKQIQSSIITQRSTNPVKPSRTANSDAKNYEQISNQALQNLEKSLTQVDKLKSTNTVQSSKIASLEAQLAQTQIQLQQQNNLIQKLSSQLTEKTRQFAEEKLTLQTEIDILRRK